MDVISAKNGRDASTASSERSGAALRRLLCALYCDCAWLSVFMCALRNPSALLRRPFQLTSLVDVLFKALQRTHL